MEINNSADGFVTNGLLVRELISGRLATGDATFTQRRAADDIPLAGDPNNNAGPTYSSLTKVASLNGDNPANSRLDSQVSDSLSQNGTVGAASSELSSKTKYVYFDPTLKHNVPAVFWEFMNQKGTIYQNGQFVNDQPILGDNVAAPWLDAMGLPITEAYWVKVTLAGESQDVLIQAFERRMLTYTPANPIAFQVEMGNVGRHYFSWRYDTKYDQTSPPVATNPIAHSCADLPYGTNGAFTLTRCGPAGMRIIVATAAQPGETVVMTGIDSYGNLQAPVKLTTESDGVTSTNFDTNPQGPKGVWTFKFHAQTSGKDSQVYVWIDPPVDKLTVIPVRKEGTIDDEFVFIVVGFKPNERLDIHVAGPEYLNGDTTAVLNASAYGGWTETFVPRQDFHRPYNVLPPIGQYSITFQPHVDTSRFAQTNFDIIDKK